MYTLLMIAYFLEYITITPDELIHFIHISQIKNLIKSKNNFIFFFNQKTFTKTENHSKYNPKVISIVNVNSICFVLSVDRLSSVSCL